jgi:hypothetical protein
MKKICLALLLAFTGYVSFAQNYDKFKVNVLAKKPEDSKKELDKLLADPKAKDKPETLFWEFATYANFFYDTTLYVKYPNADSVAWASLEAYTAKQPALDVLKENMTIFNALEYLKSASINLGIVSFNHSNWLMSLKGFLGVNKLDTFLSVHGLLKDKDFLDTTVVLYTGYAAQNSGNADLAVKYYRALADREIRIGDNKHFESNMYTFVVDHYLKNGEADNFNKYLALGKKVFPEYNSQWSQIEMQNTTTNSSLTDLIAKYKTDAASGKLTEDQYATFGDAFSQPDRKQAAKLDSASKVQLKLSAADAYSHAYKITPNAIYAYNIGVLYYNVYDEELGTRFYNLRGEGAALKAARAEVEKQQQQLADSSIAWLTQAYTTLKAKTDIEKREKNILGNSIKDHANLYQWKAEKSKGVDPKAVDKYDALYKQFDSEADKYQ